jgi:hypothetical protein
MRKDAKRNSPHISEIFSEGNSVVDRSLTSSHRHVRRVSDQTGTLHHTFIHTLDLDSKLGELHKHFSHFISTLTATNVYDGIRVGVFREGLGNHSLSAAEGTWNGTSATKHAREESVQHTLSSDKWVVALQLLQCWTGLQKDLANVEVTERRYKHLSDGPVLHQSERLLLAHELDGDDLVVKGVVARGCNVHNSSHLLGGQHDPMCDQ